MLHRALTTAVAIVLAGTLLAAPAGAEQCRDAKGKFIKCPEKPAAATKCRDKTTKKFAKCDAPNTEPVPVKKP
jgi:hypothetical protein